MPMGNLLCSSAMLLSGCSPVKAVNFLRAINIVTFSKNTYYRFQRLYILPAINRSWEYKQAALLKEVQGRDVTAGGDGRCCSPGHTAVYGSYSVMDLETSKILDMQLVKVTEVKNSYWMELEGLKRCFAKILSSGVSIKTFVTDRHTQIKKFMRDDQQEITHYFDIWHVGKASSGGRAEECREKWLSVVNHVANVHTGHGDIFKECAHGPLDDRDWIKKGSRLHKEFKEIVASNGLITDIGRLSPVAQTYSLESYHKVVIYFAPKSVHFTYPAMKGRILLSVLHFNENCKRKQAVTKSGEEQWTVSYMKYGNGNAITKEVKTPITYGIVQDCLVEVMKMREEFPTMEEAAANMEKINSNLPPNVCDGFEKKEKAVVVAARKSRFQKGAELAKSWAPERKGKRIRKPSRRLMDR
ncbi:PREDICTED: uncharacterized protein LOC106816275 isoform X1 [Priapulus caudatus]|uniref:Uncharacterized protein LOC106816275 isoform X1 n=1 Tax=Priapulus caudatus TaxID=37621 RepID=A0ABM1EVX3_PRICU|nr:PREDICTED: uncharacterized protein LOC106816275 isoform X1 [Priapulus caudatus]